MGKSVIVKNLEYHVRSLVILPSISGNEGVVRNYLTKHLKDPKIKRFIDLKGNLIVQKGNHPKKLALVAHMDKEGFMVAGIGKKSLKLVGIRKYPPFKKGLISNVYTVNKKGQKLYGKLVNEGIGQNKLKMRIEDNSKSEIGDYVAYSTHLNLHNDIITSSYLDNSIGVAVALEVLKFIKNGTVIFSAQETIGFYGIGPAIRKVKPEKVIVLDATYAHDNPINGASLFLGKGPSICIKDKILGDKKIISELTDLAKKKKIPIQQEIWEEANSDILSIHNVGEGIPACFIGLPVKNHGTNKEKGAITDMNYAFELLVNYFSFVYEK